ncbi:MAG TPA: glycosyl hydrolase family 28 protein [Draconibacterium sp.]|nr:glycosyl hydrolase family 28 protein [Draconibacterium sp.]HRX12743.1 glycosyl hydrolase family 28 protein [Draconibacterium sp.]
MKNLILVFVFSLPVFLQAQVTTWQSPTGFSSEKYYQVKVNGVEVPVYDTPVASYALFDFSGEANVEVNTMYDVRWVDIRPVRRELKPEYTGDNSFQFKLKTAGNLSVELNGRIRQQPLFVFAGEPEKDHPSKTDKNVIWFETGKLYKNVKIELQDNQTVYIEGGAVVQGYIFAEGKKNLKICGRGILEGSFNKTTPGNNNRFLYFRDCENVTVDGITLHNGTTWQIATFHCNNVNIKNTRIVSESGSDDGMDICRCTNVIIDNVFAHTKDDCVAIKSQLDYPGSHPTDNILVKNCVFWNSIWGNAIEIGFELYSDEVKNIRFENIDIIHVEDGAAMSIHNAGQAHVHNVVFENIRVEDARQKLFDVAVFFSQWGPDGNRDPEFTSKYYLHGAWDGVQKIPEGTEEYHRQFRGTVSNILFKDIQVAGGLLPFSVFHGFDSEKNVSDIKIENLTYLGKKLDSAGKAKIRQQNTKNLIVH